MSAGAEALQKLGIVLPGESEDEDPGEVDDEAFEATAEASVIPVAEEVAGDDVEEAADGEEEAGG